MSPIEASYADADVLEKHTDDEEPPSSSQKTEPKEFRDSEVQVDVVVDTGVSISVGSAPIEQAVRTAALHRGYSSGSIGVRITNDPTIRQLNAKHLGHDYATDVISFGYEADLPNVEGELVVSIDTAKKQSQEIGWPCSHELILYVVHGVLHICGMDDHQVDDRAAMRAAEETVLQSLGIDEISRFGADTQREIS